jgi:hypothetical protein
MELTNEKVIRAIRVALAILISYLYTAYVGVSDPMWVFMSAAMVLFDTDTVGGSLSKGKARLYGTFLAASFSLIFIFGFNNNFLLNVVGLTLGVFLAVYWFLGTKNEPVGGLICWTLPVLLFNSSDLRSAFLRTFNIGVGIMIALLLLKFFYPTYAKNKILEPLYKTLKDLESFMIAMTNLGMSNQEINKMYLQHESQIAGNTSKYMKLLGEIRIEYPKFPEYPDTIATTYLHMQRIFRLMNIMVFHLDPKSNQQPEYLDLINANIAKIEIALLAIQTNQSSYYIPEEWQSIPAIPDTVYNVRKNLSELEVNLIIQDELTFIAANLKKIFELRKHKHWTIG